LKDVIMKITRAENAGFCFGVKRAMKLAFEAAENNENPIYSLGPLIHNPQQVQVLAQRGVHVVSDLESLEPGDTLIIRSHGTSPATLEAAKAKHLNIVDATCPFVVKAQRLAHHLASEQYQVVIVGEGDHPEVIGLVGFAGSDARIVEKVGDVRNFPVKQRVGVIAQTTQSLDNLREIVCALLGKCDELKVFNTICHATTLRQEAALDIARKVDFMVVIGGYNSANTSRLASLCLQSGIPTRHIETSDELEASWLKNVAIVGVTAGASTPEWIIEDVVDKLEALGRKNS
jgi:(E)-4-hydroxy-3-methyl-but-2-enyl pyrophosphate reductase